MSNPLAAELGLLISLFTNVERTHSAWLSALTVTLYDNLLQFPDEVEYVWKRKWTSGTVLYLITRYFPLMVLAVSCCILLTSNDSAQLCIGFFWFLGATALFVHIIVGVILMLRLWAIHSGNRRVMTIVIAFFLLGIAGETPIVTIQIVHEKPLILPGLSGCIPSARFSWAWTYWIPFLAFESVCVVFAVVGSAQKFEKINRPLIVKRLSNDSALYFTCIALVMFTNMCLWIWAEAVLLPVGVGFAYSIHCIMGSRLLLNVRRPAEDLFVGERLPEHNQQPFSSLEPAEFAQIPAEEIEIQTIRGTA